MTRSQRRNRSEARRSKRSPFALARPAFAAGIYLAENPNDGKRKAAPLRHEVRITARRLVPSPARRFQQVSVVCQSASGRQVTVRVHGARNDSHAAKLALAQLPTAEGWRAMVVL